MERDNWDWESYSEARGGLLTEPINEADLDPLASLAAELALCMMAVEENVGGFCDDCTCQLKYHLTCTNLECETCGCYEQRLRPYIALTKITPIERRSVEMIVEAYSTGYDRDKEARAVLKELTE